MKKFSIISIVVLTFVLSLSVPAISETNDGGIQINCKGNACSDNSFGNVTIEEGAVQGGKGGKGGNAIIEKGAIKNNIHNKNKQKQKQDQDQNQSQKQSSKNKNVNKNDNTNTNTNKNKNTNTNTNEANNNGNTQDTEVTVEGDDYEAAKMHITGPELIQSDAKFAPGKKFTGRTAGSVWDKLSGITAKQAKRLGSKSSDVEIEEAILFEKDFSTNYLYKGVAGEFVGTMYVYPDGDDVTIGGMEGRAATRAMKLGATHMHRVYLDGGDVASGSSWNIGLGGGASIITNGESVAIAPNGGMGFGAAKASNTTLPDMVFEIYCSEELLDKKAKKSKKQTGNHTDHNKR